MKREIIYIEILNEGTKVWRPMWAEEISPFCYLIKSFHDYEPSDEELKFKPGEIVKCEWQQLEDEKVLIAVNIA